MGGVYSGQERQAGCPEGLGLVLAVLLAACAGQTPGPQAGGRQTEAGSAGPSPTPKAITIGVTSAVGSMGAVGGATTTVGGWVSVSEVHSNGLITSDVHMRRPVGQLAERAPSVEDGTISVLPDGRMRVVYHLRRDVTWQDGVPFTAQDLAFSFRLNGDTGLPGYSREVATLMRSAEAPDDHTFVISYGEPYYLGGVLGVRRFWPHPRHLLEEAYERYLASKNADDVVNLSYWTHDYVHLGPFRLTAFDPGEGMVFQAYDGYFLGRPKVDVIRVRLFGDDQALFSHLLAGTVDVFLESTLHTVELGNQLRERWHGTDEGTVYSKQVSHRFLAPQWRPGVQIEPSNLDVRVRAALYRALDRVALNEGLQPGHPELAAWEILPPGDPLYGATRDALRPYGYDPNRARVGLAEAGWILGPDGFLRHSSDGRRFRTAVSAVPGITREIPAYADYWRRIGLEVEEISIPTAHVRNPEYRASYPSWEASAQSGGDGIFGRLEGPAASPQTRWVGNRGGYEDPRAQALIHAYRTSLTDNDRLRTTKALSDFVAAELPILVLFGTADFIGVRKGVKALEDHQGVTDWVGPYGTYTRNAHLWDAP